MDSTIASFMHQNYDVYVEKAIEHAKKFANPSIDKLMERIMGNDAVGNLEEYNQKKEEI